MKFMIFIQLKVWTGLVVALIFFIYLKDSSIILSYRYGDEVMELIDELSAGLTDKSSKFDSKAFSLASSAVEAKVKGKLF